MALTVGSPAPAWSGKDQHGKMHSSSQYAGMWVLLYFYPEDDTPGCTEEACGFRDAFEDLQPLVTIIGVSPDDEASHKKFATKYSLPFALVADTDKKIMTAYGTDGSAFKKRTSFLVDPSGTIVQIYQDIDTVIHAQQVLDDVMAMQDA